MIVITVVIKVHRKLTFLHNTRKGSNSPELKPMVFISPGAVGQGQVWRCIGTITSPEKMDNRSKHTYFCV